MTRLFLLNRLPFAVVVSISISTAASLASCREDAAHAADPRPVKTVAVGDRAHAETLTFTGQVRAKDEVNLAFRLGGRIIVRRVDLGDFVKAGDVVARLDPQDEQNALMESQANLDSVNALKIQARLEFARQRELLKGGWTPEAVFDQARQLLLTAEGQVDAAQARVRIAQDRLSYTVLRADGPGVVTAVGADAGDVVEAGQMVVQVARQGNLDAVFDIPEEVLRTGPRDAPVDIALSDDPAVKAAGRVREVAPQADSGTRTFEVKVAILDPPPTMRLGATVTGRIKLPAPDGVEIPADALAEGINGRPAVWVVDRRNYTVSLRAIDVARYDSNGIVVSKGLEKGDLVVTAGVQMLRPGQKVRLLGDG
ncbi:MAG: efflux RND transporter periplasmic adaptor subunit [Alphaproteobacteria bacterium]|nr:efflux RND transporter periplasmic adaptor subunit [Alphaproteobacteria bacterium]MBV8413538.1 efflux RND transporter periplasmic adaptor subunit [Alphaproteobacteria bacterium]